MRIYPLNHVKKIDSKFALDSRDLDSSLRAMRYAQNDKSVDCFGDELPRNDESFVDCYKSAFFKSCNDANL